MQFDQSVCSKNYFMKIYFVLPVPEYFLYLCLYANFTSNMPKRLIVLWEDFEFMFIGAVSILNQFRFNNMCIK